MSSRREIEREREKPTFSFNILLDSQDLINQLIKLNKRTKQKKER